MILQHLKEHHHHWVGFILACVAIALIANIAIAAPAIPAVWAALSVLNWQLICSAAVALSALGAYMGYRAFGMDGEVKLAYFALASVALLCVLPMFFLAAPGAYFGLCHWLGFQFAQSTLSAAAIKVGYCMAGVFGIGTISNTVMAASLTQRPWANACIKLLACGFLAGVGVCIVSTPVGIGLMLGSPLLACAVGRISAAVGDFESHETPIGKGHPAANVTREGRTNKATEPKPGWSLFSRCFAWGRGRSNSSNTTNQSTSGKRTVVTYYNAD